MNRYWRKAFLQALRDTANVRAACMAAGVNSSTVYRARARDRDFRRKWDRAMDEAADLLFAEAMRRATKGIETPVFYRGRQTATRVHKSDALLMFLLRGLKPEVFGNKEPAPESDSKGAIVELMEHLREQRKKDKRRKDTGPADL